MLNIIGGVCLLLWGLGTVRKGVTRAFGSNLHTIISRSTSNRVYAFLTGIGVTTLLQSSTATALIISSFCGHGLMTVTAGVAVMLGADLGTTLVAQILSFDFSWLAPFFLFSGYFIYRLFKNKNRMQHVGRLFIGLGLMLLALAFIKLSAEPLKTSETLALVLHSLGNEPILAVLCAALLTWVMHSSLATILLFVTLASSGVLDVNIALIMVLGANLGGAIAPIVTTMREGRAASRVPVANMVMRFISVLLVFPFIGVAHELIAYFGDTPERMIVNFHTAFNIGVVVLFLPVSHIVARRVETWMPDQIDHDDPSVPKYLDEKHLETPSIALSDAMRETLRMAEMLETMLDDLILALRQNNEKLLNTVIERDDVLDGLYKAIKYYMAKIMHESLDEEDAQQYIQILAFATNLEGCGDTVVKSMADMAEKKIRKKSSFSHDGWAEIKNIHKHVLDTLRLSQNVLLSGDRQLARRLVESKDTIREYERKTSESHLNRIRDGVPETIATSSIHLDIIRDYRRINSLLATVAYPILEDAGDLMTRRLKPIKK